MIRAITSLALALGVLACTDDGGNDDESTPIPECVEYTLEGCAPLYPATYDQIWEQTFSDGCAEFGTACHAQDDAAGATNGLTFSDPQISWNHLTMTGALVEPGDPLCSPLFVRLVSDDPAIRMPPGNSGLDDGVLCSIGTWIADGAQYVQP